MTFRTLASIVLEVAAASAAAQAPYIEGELLVKFRTNASRIQELAANARIGAHTLQTIPGLKIKRIQLPQGLGVAQAVQYYRGLPMVQYAEPNFIGQAILTPNDPAFGQQYGPKKMNCVLGWDVSIGNSAVKIAILDTGVDASHPDLASKMLPGFDFINNDDDAQDDHGHGTHVAGTAAASTNNGVGVAGVGFNCSIIPVKVLSGGGSGPFSAIIDGIRWAADQGAHVINLSLGSYGDSQGLHDAVNYAWGKGTIVVAGVGNDNTSEKFYPAAYPNAIAVGGTDQNDAKAGFSNHGADWVDVAAPGVSIHSTTLGGGYGGASGTSMSSPHVAGMAGLLRSHSASATKEEVRAAIENTTVFVGNWLAKGRVNVHAALQAVNPPISINYSPLSVAPLEGTFIGGVLADIQLSDNQYFSVRSVNQPALGHTASAIVSFQLSHGASSYREAKLRIEALGSNKASNMVYAWNWQAGVYEYVNSHQLYGSGNRVAHVNLLSNLPRFLSSSGEVRVLLRGLVPARFVRNGAGVFTYRVDQVRLEAKVAQ